MIGNLNLFSSINKLIQTDVTLGNNIQVIVLGKCIVGILIKQGEHKTMPDVYYVKGLKHNLRRIGKLLQRGYRVYMEDNHCVIKDIRPSNRLIEKVPMTRNHLFPLRIIPDMKGKENSRATFKEERKEVDKHFDKKENNIGDFQAAFQTKV